MNTQAVNTPQIPVPSNMMSKVVRVRKKGEQRPDFGLSDHALLRLGERSSMPAEELLGMLNAKAYVGLAMKIDKGSLYSKEWMAGLSLAELRSRGIDIRKHEVVHLMVWSARDQKTLTVIAARQSRSIITVLDSEHESLGLSWTNSVTPDMVELARLRQEAHSAGQCLEVEPEVVPHVSRVIARVRWMTAANMPHGKEIPGLALSADDMPLSNERLADLAAASIEYAAGGYDVHLDLTVKKPKYKLMAEYKLEKTASGSIEITPV